MHAEVVLIDNFDSFTYNLYDELSRLGANVFVYRNKLPLSELLEIVATGAVSHLVISPGPGRPEQSGISLAAFQCRELAALPMLGVCLGMQALACAHGGQIDRLSNPVHGKSSTVELTPHRLFSGLSSTLAVGRYHSLYVSRVPPSCRVLSWLDEIPMAIEHREQPHFGVQFHPESIMTEAGSVLLRNFLQIRKGDEHACREAL